MLKKSLVLISVVVLSGCITSPGPDIMPSQPGDQYLTCPQLANELSQLDSYIYDTERSLALSGYSNNSVNRAAQRAARDATDGQYSGYVSDLMGMSRDWERQQAQTQQFNLQKARERHRNLSSFYQQKGCR